MWSYRQKVLADKGNPVVNRRRLKRINAVAKGKGERTPNGTKFVSGCPFCEWERGRPQQVQVGTEASQAVCRVGHVWLLI